MLYPQPRRRQNPLYLINISNVRNRNHVSIHMCTKQRKDFTFLLIFSHVLAHRFVYIYVQHLLERARLINARSCA